MTTNLCFRWVKILCVKAIGIMALLVTFGNCTDYFSNYHFVEHVLKMDTIFPDSTLHYRSIQQPWLWHTSYIFIIVLEAIMGITCMLGTWQMWINRNQSAAAFHAAKKWAVIGIGIGIFIWFMLFEVFGGEWFAMWQSSIWNGLSAAERITGFLMLSLLLLYMKEEELPPLPVN